MASSRPRDEHLPHVRERFSLRPEGTLSVGREPDVYAAARSALWTHRWLSLRGAGRRGVSQLVRRHPPQRAVSCRADQPQAIHRGLTDRRGGRKVGRGDLGRQARAGQGAVSLGPGREEGRAQLVLGAGVECLGGKELGRRAHSAHRSGGDRRFPGRRSRPTDHHGAGLQRRPSAALCAPRRPDAERYQVAELQERRDGQLQRNPVRGQEGERGAVRPR